MAAVDEDHGLARAGLKIPRPDARDIQPLFGDLTRGHLQPESSDARSPGSIFGFPFGRVSGLVRS